MIQIEFIERGYFKWHAFIIRNNERIGTIYYADKPVPALSISIDRDELRIHISQGNFFNGGGRILYNGECVASWLAKIPVDLTITNMRRITIMKLKIDDWERRFKWAYRQGISWKLAWQYASWGQLLIGQNFALCSVINPRFGWQFGATSNPFNSFDETIVEHLPRMEQLMVLFIVYRRLCSVYPNMTKSPSWIGLGKNCPNVPSFIEKDKCGQSYLIFDPNQVLKENKRKCLIGEFLATGHPICWLFISICTVVCIFSSEKSSFIGGIIFGLVPTGYLILTWLLSSSTIKEVMCTSNFSNSNINTVDHEKEIDH